MECVYFGMRNADCGFQIGASRVVLDAAPGAVDARLAGGD
jgi:hypothetical protein